MNERDTLGFAALGAYVLRNSVGGTGILFFLLAFACIFGLNSAANRGHEQLAMGLLFALGLLLGMAVAPVLDYYAKTNPGIIYCVGMLAVFGFFTAFDFQRLSHGKYTSAVPIAASIFLDIFNVFLLLLSLFSGQGRR